MSASKQCSRDDMQKFSLRCFGTGDGWPCADRNHAAFLYQFDSTSILLDCGEPVDRSLKASGVSYDAIDGIFLSHLHADHVGGLFMLLQGFWLEGRKRSLPLHLPGKSIRSLRAMLEAMFLFKAALKFQLRLVPLRSEKAAAIGDVCVRAFKTTHLNGTRARFQKHYPVDFSSYCFLLEAGSVRVGHSADLGRPQDLEPLLRQPLDLLVCELAHFTPKEIFSYLHGRRIGKIAFVHLARQHRKNFGAVRKLAARILPDIPHRFPEDGDTIRL